MQASIDGFINPDGSEESHEAFLNSLLVSLDLISAFDFNSLIVLMESSLTSADPKIRERGALLLSELLDCCKGLLFSLEDVRTMTKFFVARLSDLPSVLHSLSSIHSLLVKYYNFEEDIYNNIPRSIVLSLLVNLHLPSHAQAVRKAAFDIIEVLLDNNRFVPLLVTMNEDLVSGFAGSMDGEKDPRCLVQCFRITKKILSLYNTTDVLSEEVIEQVFDSLSCYFPISFKPPVNDPFKISPQMLSTLLSEALIAHPALHYHTIPLILDKLQAASMSSQSLINKIDILLLLKQIIASTHLSPVFLHMDEIVSSLARICTSSSEIALVTTGLNVLSLAATKLLVSNEEPFDKVWSVFVDHIIGPCSILMKRSIVNVFGRSATRTMTSLSSTSIIVLSRLVSVLAPIVYKHVTDSCALLSIDCPLPSSSSCGSGSCCQTENTGGGCCQDKEVATTESSLVPAIEMMIDLLCGIDVKVDYCRLCADPIILPLVELADNACIIISSVLNHSKKPELRLVAVNLSHVLIQSSRSMPLISRQQVTNLLLLLLSSAPNDLIAMIKKLSNITSIDLIHEPKTMLSDLINSIIIQPQLTALACSTVDGAHVIIDLLSRISLISNESIASSVMSVLVNVDLALTGFVWSALSDLLYANTFLIRDVDNNLLILVIHQTMSCLFERSVPIACSQYMNGNQHPMHHVIKFLVCLPGYDLAVDLYHQIAKYILPAAIGCHISDPIWILSIVFVNALPVDCIECVTAEYLTSVQASLLLDSHHLHSIIMTSLLANKLPKSCPVKSLLIDSIQLGLSQANNDQLVWGLRCILTSSNYQLFSWGMEFAWNRIKSGQNISFDRIMSIENFGLVNPQELTLIKLTPPVICIKTKIFSFSNLWQQRLFSSLIFRFADIIPPDVGDKLHPDHTPSPCILLSLVQLCSHVPRSVMLEASSSLISAIVMCLVWSRDNTTMVDAARELQFVVCPLLLIVLENKQVLNQLSLHLTCISYCLIEIASSHPNARTRLASLDCLRSIALSFSYAKLHESRLHVLKRLVPVLNDNKRTIRQMAALVRNEWYIAGPG